MKIFKLATASITKSFESIPMCFHRAEAMASSSLLAVCAGKSRVCQKRNFGVIGCAESGLCFI